MMRSVGGQAKYPDGEGGLTNAEVSQLSEPSGVDLTTTTGTRQGALCK